MLMLKIMAFFLFPQILAPVSLIPSLRILRYIGNEKNEY